ncbi:peptidase inhibitor family I36 protein [Cellulomonas timonensis]|uniref:peptidase inhibitor family I36 protein n=1 Tax=Cellulomonas timonensis TaxID=1689271 RepID=UPI000833C9C0|nr:peptidase inhibitor family I36 protein [Cellulomonas timonensis]
MRRLRKFAAAAGAVAVMTVGTVAVATPASAGDGACSLGYACAWQHSNYDGSRVTFQNFINNFGSLSFDNQASSLRNNGRTSNAAFYLDAYFRGSSVILNRGYLWSNLQGTGFQDSISSASFI